LSDRWSRQTLDFGIDNNGRRGVPVFAGNSPPPNCVHGRPHLRQHRTNAQGATLQKNIRHLPSALSSISSHRPPALREHRRKDGQNLARSRKRPAQPSAKISNLDLAGTTEAPPSAVRAHDGARSDGQHPHEAIALRTRNIATSPQLYFGRRPPARPRWRVHVLPTAKPIASAPSNSQKQAPSQSLSRAF